MKSRRLFATTTDVNTAMAETALCSKHNTETNQQAVISRVSEPDGSDLVFYDCTDNDALSCRICGWPEKRKVRVAVSDEEGTILDIFETEVETDTDQADVRVAREAVLDVAQDIRLGLV